MLQVLVMDPILGALITDLIEAVLAWLHTTLPAQTSYGMGHVQWWQSIVQKTKNWGNT